MVGKGMNPGDFVFYDSETGRYIKGSDAIPKEEPQETPRHWTDSDMTQQIYVPSSESQPTPRVPCRDIYGDGLELTDAGSEPTEVIDSNEIFGFPVEGGDGGGGDEPLPEDAADYPEHRRHRGLIIAAVAAVALVAGGTAYAENFHGIRGGSGGGNYTALPTASSSSSARASSRPSSTNTASPRSTATPSSSKPVVKTSKPTPRKTQPSSSVPPSPTSTVVAPVIPSTPEGCVAATDLNWRINQTLTVGTDGAELDSGSLAVTMLEKNNIGGVVVMSEPSTMAGLNRIKTLRNAGLFVGTDQEGGTVQRFKDPNLANGKLPSAQEAAQTMSPSAYEALVEKDMAYLNSIGITTDFAPVTDVAPEHSDSTEGATRPYSSDPKVVSEYVAAFVEGAKKGGVNTVLKHFPGMGRASANTDFGAALTPPLESLKQIDWQPYRNLSDKAHQDVMIGTPVVPEWGKLPAALVPQAYRALTEMGYTDGVKWTDSLNARGAGGTSVMSGALEATGMNIAQATSAALIAGATSPMMVAYHGGDLNFTKDITAIDEQVTADIKSGKLTEKQLNRAVLTNLGAKGIDACTVLKNPAK